MKAKTWFTALVLSFIGAAMIRANTFNIPDGDIYALKNAISFSNTNNVPDTINLATNGTYTLTTADNDIGGPNGLPVVEKDLADPQVDLVINGNGATIARAAGAGLFRLLHVRGGVICTINNVRFYNALGFNYHDDSSQSGGALFNEESQVTLNGCRFDSNVSVGAMGIQDSSLCDGRPAYGGAIYSTGVLAVYGCTFINNGTAGGKASTVNAAPCQLGAGEGGAIYSSTENLTVTNCTFTNNYSNSGARSDGSASDSGRGAGVVAYGGSFSDNSLTDNTAGYGGAMFFWGTASLTRCALNSNTAFLDGGAIYIGYSSNVSMTDCIIDGNEAGEGGGIYTIGAGLTIIGTSFSGNQATDRNGQFSAFGGGAIHCYSFYETHVLITNSRFTDNRAGYDGSTDGGSGGAIFFSSSYGDAAMSYCVFSGNHASNGGGIYSTTANTNYNAVLTLTNSTFSANDAIDGAGVYFQTHSIGSVGTLNLTNCTFSGNQLGSATGCSGAGVYNQAENNATSNVAMTNCTFSANNAEFGGAMENVRFQNKGVASISLRNTILNAGSVGPNIDNYGGTITSLGHNISSDAAGGNTGTAPGGFLDAAGDKRNTDPKLGALAPNGGPTQTHALLTGSPAINTGAAGPPDRDQRAFLRSGAVDIGAFEFAGSLAPITAGSNKTQGPNSFGVDFPLTGTPGVECRSGGSNGNYTLILNFGTPVTIGGANVTSGVGSTNGVLVNGSYVSVLLTNIANAQQIVVTLSNVSDGTHTNNVNIPARFLLGDTNGDGAVNSADVAQTKSKSGQNLDSTNFRNDVNADGLINSADISLVKSKSGTAIP